VAEVVRPDEYPTWVPDPVLGQAERLLAQTESDDEKALIRRLLTDQRMKGVWRELTNPKRCPASAAARDQWPRAVVPKGMNDQDVAVALFFFYSHVNAIDVLPVKVAKWKLGHDLRLGYINELRQAANSLWLNWFEDLEAEKHDAAIMAAASFYETSEMRLFSSPPTYLIDRVQGNPKLRTYALKMAAEGRRLFGKSMYGTIAKVTNVALVKKNKSEISRRNVEQWCSAAVTVTARFSAAS
jgi:hypothetical protein